jgi:hypothetical protein
MVVVGGTILFRQSTKPSSTLATASDVSTSATVQPEPVVATVPSLSTTPPDESEQSKMGAALEAVEQARQQKNAEPVMATTARGEAVSSSQRRPANPPASRVNEWQVTENHTRKVH